MQTNLLVEPLIDGKTHGTALQAKKFSFGFKISNCGDMPSDEFTINQITLGSSEGQNIVEDFGKKKFFVETLNPGQSKLLNIANTGQSMYGLVNVRVQALPEDTSKQIAFWQKNPYTEEISKVPGLANQWIDFFYIQSRNNYLQEKTSYWTMRLTWVMAGFTFIQILPILKNIWGFLLRFLA